jgi:Tfp pilus assembly major pilin PilA
MDRGEIGSGTIPDFSISSRSCSLLMYLANEGYVFALCNSNDINVSFKGSLGCDCEKNQQKQKSYTYEHEQIDDKAKNEPPTKVVVATLKKNNSVNWASTGRKGPPGGAKGSNSSNARITLGVDMKPFRSGSNF